MPTDDDRHLDLTAAYFRALDRGDALEAFACRRWLMEVAFGDGHDELLEECRVLGYSWVDIGAKLGMEGERAWGEMTGLDRLGPEPEEGWFGPR